jgi:tetratricopeptide (TPR) repeat protein
MSTSATRPPRRVLLLAGVLLAGLRLAAPTTAAEPGWLKLQAPQFGVLSQLDEAATRKWAVEFDQFIAALQTLYKVPDASLPPLTIVLFRSQRAFDPYRRHIGTGGAVVDGFFANRGTWSVIGLAGRRSRDETRRIVQHEAVHWFLSGADVELPPWFHEGLAEVYSTFEVRDDKGRFGAPIALSRDFLDYAGVQPIEDFLRTPQAAVLHGSNERYYPQAWAFVHYLVFGNGGANRPRLATLLRGLQDTDLDSAFTAAFGRSYDDVTRDLRGYLTGGRFSMLELELPQRGDVMQVSVASPGNVEVSLARLALGGGSDDLARQHTGRVVEIAPGSPAGHELLALLALQAGDEAAAIPHLDRAIELGSVDADVYAMRGRALLPAATDVAIDDIASPAVARRAADLFVRAIALRPTTREAHENFVVALANVDTIHERDAAVLAIGRRVLPANGFMLVGEAIVARHRDDLPEALRLLRSAQAQPFELRRLHRAVAGYLHDKWLYDSVRTQVNALLPERRFAEALALLDTQLADTAVAGRLRNSLESARADVDALQRLEALEQQADRGEDIAPALRALIDDPATSDRVRRTARRALQRLP